MGAKWISIEKRSERSALYLFKKEFYVDSAIKSFKVKFSADTRYRLYINGKEFSHGPCQSSPFVKYFEEVECAGGLKVGKNEICISVFHAADPFHFGTMPRRDKPALYFAGVLSTEKEETVLYSDESFRIYRAEHLRFEGRPVMPSVPPFEAVGGEPLYTELKCISLYETSEVHHCHDYWGTMEPYVLEPRPIKMLYPKESRELSVVKEYSEDGKYHLIFDAVKYTTAMVDFRFSAPEGTDVRISYVECARSVAEDGSLFKGVRDDFEGVIDSEVYDLVTANGKQQHYSPYFMRVFRFIHISSDKKPEYFRVFAARYTYDFEESAVKGGVGRFECSDEMLNKAWDISRNTAECTAHEIFVDCAFHEQQQYVGDARFEAIYCLRLSNDVELMKKVIIDTAHSQLPDGQIMGNYPNVSTQILTIAAPYYIDLIREYLRFTGDVAFVKSMTGVCDRLLSFYENSRNEQGLVLPPYGCRFIDWVDGWEIGTPKGFENKPLTVESLMYAAALKSAGEICEASGRFGLAAEYKSRYTDLISCINEHCFDKKRGLYLDGPDLNTYCEHSTVWAILSGAIKGEEARELMLRSMASNEVARCSFSKNYDTLRALEKTGLYEEYAPKILLQWKDMIDKHCTTWVEDPVSERSECHGWSSVPMYEASAMILGVYPLSDGFKGVRIKPTTLGLSFARGRVPTPCGFIDVAWWYESDKFHMQVKCSNTMEMVIICPNGDTLKVENDNFEI